MGKKTLTFLRSKRCLYGINALRSNEFIYSKYCMIPLFMTDFHFLFTDQEMSSSSSDTCTFQGHVRSDLFRKAKRKALRMSIVIVAAFIVCWTPYYVLFTCFTFFDIREMPQRTMLYLSFIGLSNSLLNPIIYGAFHLCNVHSPRSERRRYAYRDYAPFVKIRTYSQRTSKTVL